MSRPSSPSTVQPRLGELLWRRGACDRNTIRRALSLQARYGDRLGTNLLASGWVSEKDLALALGEQLGVHAAYGELIEVETEARALIDASIAAKHAIVPHHVDDGILYALMTRPHDEEALSALRGASQLEISPVVVCEARMWKLLQEHYEVRVANRALVPLDQEMIEEREPNGITSFPHAEGHNKIASEIGPAAGAATEDDWRPPAPNEPPAELEPPKESSRERLSSQSMYNQIFQDFPGEFRSEPTSRAAAMGPAASTPANPSLSSSADVAREEEATQHETVSIGNRKQRVAQSVTLATLLDEETPATSHRGDAALKNDPVQKSSPPKMHAMVKKFQSHKSENPSLSTLNTPTEPPSAPTEADEKLKALYQQLFHPSGAQNKMATDVPSLATEHSSQTHNTRRPNTEPSPIKTHPHPAPSVPQRDRNPKLDAPTPRANADLPVGQPPAAGKPAGALHGNYRQELSRRLQENKRLQTPSTAKPADAMLEAAAVLDATRARDPATGPETLRPRAEQTEFVQKIFQQTPTRFRRLALLSVHTDQITGAQGEGDLPLQRVRNFRVSRDASSVFQWVAESKTPYVGPLQTTPANELWIDATGGQRPNSVAVLPVFVRGDVLYLLYGDNGHEVHVSGDISELSALAQRISDGCAFMSEFRQNEPNPT